MARMTLRRSGNSLVPANISSGREMLRIPEGEILHANVGARRNIRFHRMYWALCTYIAEALNAGPGKIRWTQEMVSDRLKIATGRAQVIRLGKREAARYGCSHAIKPASISFAAMDETEFGDFVDECVRFVLDHFGRWVERHPDWHHVREILFHARGGSDEDHQQEGT